MPGMTERKRYMREETTARGDYEAIPHKYIAGGKVTTGGTVTNYKKKYRRP